MRTTPLCQHLIGYLEGNGHGAAGLEKALDGFLAGTGQHMTPLPAVLRRRAGCVPEKAAGLTLQPTAERRRAADHSRPVQRAVEAVAAEMMTSGCILVLDTATAAVRACVSVPGYDPAASCRQA